MTRLMLTIILVLVVAFVAYQVGLNQMPQEDTTRARKIFGLDQPRAVVLADTYTDSDGDRVADTPTDPAQLADPETIYFSYVAAPDAEAYETAWKPLVNKLAEATGKKVEYVKYESADDQLQALKEGKLHVTATNTGNVPEAVSLYGFVPIAAPAKEDGGYGYTMKIIAPGKQPD